MSATLTQSRPRLVVVLLRYLRQAPLILLVALPALAMAGDAPAADHSLTNGAWSYFGDPRAVSAAGVTFVGWVTSAGDVQVGTISRGGFRKVTLDNMGADDHSNPSLFFRRDGRLVALYASHRPINRPEAIYYRVATAPYSIEGWGPVRSITTNTKHLRGQPSRAFAYPNPVQMGRRVWLFWRGGNWWPTFSYTTDWVHWKRARNVVRGDRGRRPYVKVAARHGTAYLAFTQAHPDSSRTGIYFLKIGANGLVSRASGRRIGSIKRPVSYRRADAVYRFRRRSGRAWIMDVAVRADGKPIVLYFRRDPAVGDQYRYARWNGRRWTDHRIVEAGAFPLGPRDYYQTGASLDHENPGVVYLSRKRSTQSKFEVEAWYTWNQGATWQRQEVTHDSPRDNWRPISPRGSRGFELLFLQGRYLGYQNFNMTLTLHD